MRGSQLVTASVLVSLLSVTVQGAVRTYDWTVDYAFFAPDCVEKLIISINGEYPGPVIRATEGDTVIVNVLNKLPTESIVIHWHGMIQAGTYFYHGHHGMQRMGGFYGSLIVDPKPNAIVPFEYDGELSIIVNDWWHKSFYEQEIGLHLKTFRWVGEPQSLLIEGRGAYNCSKVPTGAVPNSGDCVTCNASNPMCAPFVLPVEAGKTYRLRIASVTSLAALNFILEGHKMTVVEVDGHYVEPVVVENLDVYSGESYSVLFTADQDASKNYWAATNVRARKPNTPTGLAVLNYLPNPSTMLPTTPAPVSPLWNDFVVSMDQARLYKARRGFITPLPRRSTNKRITLLNTQNRYNGVLKWALNNVTWHPTSTPILAAYKYRLNDGLSAAPPSSYTPGYDIFHPPVNPNTTSGHGVYEFELNDVVDVILQNANTLTPNNSEVHPWHLHGHDFWVMGFGNGVFNASSDYAKLNYFNPPLRNTVPLFPYGWTFLRFVADNPGVWPFHCHIEPHAHMGMGVMFAEGTSRLPSIPQQALGCGLTKNLINTRP